MLLSQAATPIITALPSIPPTPEHPYTGAQATGAARVSLQHALDNYRIGNNNFPSQVAPSELSGPGTQSFGDSHASELANINPIPQSIPPQVPHTSTQLSSTVAGSQSPVNPATLNLSPTPIPSPAQPSPPAIVPDTLPTTFPVPTVAETGIPITAEAANLGPVSGSLHESRRSDLTGLASSAPNYQTAEEEKRRLAAAYSQQPVSQGQASKVTPVPYEIYEKETSPLEREERDGLLRAGSTGLPQRDEKPDKDDELPPYQDVP